MNRDKIIEKLGVLLCNESEKWWKGKVHHETELDGYEAYFEWLAESALNASGLLTHIEELEGANQLLRLMLTIRSSR
jgi:hypothetical protein